MQQAQRRRTTEEQVRRPSMGDDFVANLAQSDWAKLMEEEMANADN